MERDLEDKQVNPYKRLASVILGGRSFSSDELLTIQSTLERLESIDINKIGVDIVRKRWLGLESKSEKEIAKEMELQPLAIRKHQARIFSALKHALRARLEQDSL